MSDSVSDEPPASLPISSTAGAPAAEPTAPAAADDAAPLATEAAGNAEAVASPRGHKKRAAPISDQTTPGVTRTSTRDRKASKRLTEAEEDAMILSQRDDSYRPKKKKKAKSPKPQPKPKTPSRKKAPPPVVKKPPPPAPKPPKPHLLVILINVDDQGNWTEFYVGDKSKLRKKEVDKLGECHHGAMNNDKKVYDEVMAILRDNFTKVDDLYYHKSDVGPTKIDKHVSEVYHMHFGGFPEDDGFGDNDDYGGGIMY